MIYLDNAATTPISPKIKSVLEKTYIDNFGNPSSTHFIGKKSRELLEDSRNRIARVIKLEARNIYFTSGATESANIIIQGRVNFLRNANSTRNEIVISTIEHPCVDSTASFLEKNGFVIKRARTDSMGVVDEVELKKQITKNTAVVALMHVNNEIGTIQNIARLSEVCKGLDPGIMFVTDIVQAIGKIPMEISEHIDALFVSGHKIGTPKGMGFFYLNPKFRLQPIIFGGNQEAGYRSGTTSANNAFLLAEAIGDRVGNLQKNIEYVSKLNELFTSTCNKFDIRYQRTIEKTLSSPFILSLAFPGLKATSLLDDLSEKGVCISQGSACSSNNHTKSRVLEAINLPIDLIDSTVRISFSPENTEKQVIETVKVIADIVKKRK